MRRNMATKMLKGVMGLGRITMITLLIQLLIFPAQNLYVNAVNSLFSMAGIETRAARPTMDLYAAQGLQLETGTVSLGGTWTTVTLNNNYTSPVVVCVINYNNNSTPVVPRVRNAAGNSFEVKIQSPSGTAVSADTVHYLVVEEGVWQLPDGRNIEAAKVTSDGVSENDNFTDLNQTEVYSYQQSYTTPVVIGQVMTENDADWSAFWSCGSTELVVPDSTTCHVGKHVGEDTDITRADETLGVVVIEAGSGSIDGVPYEIAVSGEFVKGMDSIPPPPYIYTLSSFSATPEIGIVCQSAMDGADGSWVYLYGAAPLSAASMGLAADEDQVNDSERKHTAEQICFIVFESSVLISAGTPPVASDDSYQVDENTTLNVSAPGVLGNDTDAESDPLTAILVTDAANGTLNLNSDGSFSYTPDAGFIGTDSFIYKANDGSSDSNDATVTITVIDVPEPPVANNDSYQIDENTTLNIAAPGVLGNDTDPENDPLTAILVTDAANGTLTLNSDGSFDYTPDTDFNGMDSFIYKANDGNEDSNNATVTITVIPVSVSGLQLESDVISVGGSWTTVTLNNVYQSPVVICSINYNNNSIPVLTRVRNAAGNSFEIKLQNPSGTAVSAETVHYLVVQEGSWQLPDGRNIEASKIVSDQVNYKGNFADNSLMEVYNYQNSYTAPVVLGQVMTENDTSWSAFWSCRDTELEPPNATICYVGKHVGEDTDNTRASETLGVIVIEAGSGTIDGTPYETALGSEIIKGVDNAPPYSYSLNNFSSAPQVGVVCQSAMDGSDGAWAYLFGAVPLSASSINLAVDEDQINDTERKHTAENVTYIVFEAPVLITGTVTPEPPVANDDSYQVDEETTLNVSAPGVLGNDTDANNDPLTAILVTDVANGTLTLNSDGSFDYTPDAGFIGADSFTYKANDGTDDSNVATVTITVVDVPEAPTANNDSYQVNQDTTLNIPAPGVLGNDTDPENDPLTAILVTDVANGTLTLNSDGSFSYTPDAGYTGSDSFTYKANDGGLDSNNATVTITVIDVPEPPTANNDSYQTDKDTTLNVSAPGVLGNDTDPENDPLTAILVTDAANGTLTLNSDGSFSYTPDAGFTGADSFTYKANDGNDDSNVAAVTITVSDVQVPPTAFNDSYNVDQDSALNVSAPGVLGNDTDGNNDPLTAILVSDAANGTLNLNSDGSFSYTPDAGYVGSDSFTYKANDGTDDSNNATVTITVIDVPEAPTANNDSYQVDQDTTLNVSAPGVLGNDTDPENDPITAILVNDVNNGSLTLNSDGSFSYTPNAGYTGTDNFTYKANDGGLDSNNATVTINVIDGSTPSMRMETGKITAGANWTTVPLAQTYTSPVVVSVINYNNNANAVVSRIRNASGNSFEVKIQSASATAAVSDIVHYIVVEEGAWILPDGRKIEAARVLSDATSDNNTFTKMNLMELYSYQHSYNSPVVMGQVMTENDFNWSAFWTCNGDYAYPPDSTTCYVGKHVGEDPTIARADEILGVIVVEEGNGTANGTPYEAKLGPATVQSVENNPPYLYTISGFNAAPEIGIACMNAMNGVDGGWAYLAGADPFTTTSMNLLVDEDQIADTERKHAAEPVAYLVFEQSVILGGAVTNDVPPLANNDSYEVDQDNTLNVSAPGVLGNDIDFNGDPITAILVSDVANGSLNLNSDGSFVYTPNTGFQGDDSFTYKANDGDQDSDIATVTIHIIKEIPVTGNVTFFQVADLHYDTGTVSYNRALVDRMNALPGTSYPSSVGGTVDTPSGVVVSGDVTDWGGRESVWSLFVTDYGLIGENRLNYPVYEGWGNHDDAIDGSCAMLPDMQVRNPQRPDVVNISANGYHYSWDWEHVHFIHVNIYAGDSGRTHDNPKKSLPFLISDLAENIGDTGRPVVIFQHFDMEASTTWWSGSEKTAMYNAIKDYNIIGIFVGHSHYATHTVWNGIDTYNPGSAAGGRCIVVNINHDQMSVMLRSSSSWSSTWTKTIDLMQ